MRRDTQLFVAVCALCVVLLLVAIVLYRRSVSYAGELQTLRAEFAEATREPETDEIREGGAETDPPPRQAVTSEYTFPIAETDYLALTSPYGYRTSPILHVERYHQGVDIASTWRAQVVAAADGVVVEHWPAPDGYWIGHEIYGGLVVLEHENGWRTAYAHLSETRVHTGWEIRAGEVIGRVGSTGRSRGEHLHFEMRDAAGQWQNPLLYVRPNEVGQ